MLRVPLSEPLFLLGTLFILVVLFLPGGLAGTIDAWWRRRRGEKVRLSLRSIDDADAEAVEAHEPVDHRAQALQLALAVHTAVDMGLDWAPVRSPGRPAGHERRPIRPVRRGNPHGFMSSRTTNARRWIGPYGSGKCTCSRFSAGCPWCW